MKKMINMILVAAMFACVLTACGGSPNAEAPAESSEQAAADGKTYTAEVKGNEVKFTLNDDNTEVSIEVMGMILEASIEVSDNKMTFKGKINGNDQIWNGFAGTTYTLNDDGTAVVDE